MASCGFSFLRRLATAALAGIALACAPLHTPGPSDPDLAALLSELAAAPDAPAAAAVERRVWARWTVSGSPTVDLLLQRAAAAEAAGDPGLARALLSEACDLAPAFAEPWNRRAALAYDAGDHRGAIDAIEETLKREPRHFGALVGLGVVYEEIGEPRAALMAYREALAIHPFLEAARQGEARLSARLSGRDA